MHTYWNTTLNATTQAQCGLHPVRTLRSCSGQKGRQSLNFPGPWLSWPRTMLCKGPTSNAHSCTRSTAPRPKEPPPPCSGSRPVEPRDPCRTTWHDASVPAPLRSLVVMVRRYSLKGGGPPGRRCGPNADKSMFAFNVASGGAGLGLVR